MSVRTMLGQRLVALFLLGCLLFGFPVLSLFEGGSLFGVPRLYLWLFAAWALLVAAIALVAERTRD